jgi:hypothetical protein
MAVRSAGASDPLGITLGLDASFIRVARPAIKMITAKARFIAHFFLPPRLTDRGYANGHRGIVRFSRAIVNWDYGQDTRPGSLPNQVGSAELFALTPLSL